MSRGRADGLVTLVCRRKGSGCCGLGVCYRGLNNYLYSFGVPYYIYSIMGPKTLHKKVPILSHLECKWSLLRSGLEDPFLWAVQEWSVIGGGLVLDPPCGVGENDQSDPVWMEDRVLTLSPKPSTLNRASSRCFCRRCGR